MSEALMEARAAAMAVIGGLSPSSSEAVDYSSHGRVAVAGDVDNWPPVLAAVRRLGDAATMTLLEDSAAAFPVAQARDGVATTRCRVVSAAGHLGAFVLRAQDGDGEAVFNVDAVLDLRAAPLFARRVLPPGCLRPGAEADALREAVESLRGLRGVFRKPKYYRYRESLCAHRAGQGCSLCIAACPAEAIVSAGNKIEVDSHLCQGCGACALACPGGAMRYDYPPPRDVLSALRAAAAAFRARAGAAAPLALFHSAADAALFEDAAPPLVPLALEEVGAAGMEMWLGALAYGFGGVALFAAGAEARALLENQVGMANDVLAAIHLPRAIQVTADRGAVERFAEEFAGGGLTTTTAKFAPSDDKRAMFFAALDFLMEHGGRDGNGEAAEVVGLGAGAPFGEIEIDAGKCTLCMACAGACPASAVRAGGDSPRLLFVEENCLQCGLCASACPEEAVSLRGRLLFSREARRSARVLNEDAPFGCAACGRPFATARMIARVEEKLRGHWMWRDEGARRRLRLCEDCRAAEMFGGEFIRRSDRDDAEKEDG